MVVLCRLDEAKLQLTMNESMSSLATGKFSEDFEQWCDPKYLTSLVKIFWELASSQGVLSANKQLFTHIAFTAQDSKAGKLAEAPTIMKMFAIKTWKCQIRNHPTWCCSCATFVMQHNLLPDAIMLAIRRLHVLLAKECSLLCLSNAVLHTKTPSQTL